MTTAVKNVGRTVVEWDQDLGEEMADDRVAEIVGPMILISVAGERVLRPVVDAVHVHPEERHLVQRAVGPVHAEAHDV